MDLLKTLLFAGSLLAVGACQNSITETLSVGPANSQWHGMVVADEPQAALVARSVLQEGGNAIDAAVSLAFALSVTYQASAGLGGAGQCLVYSEERKTFDLIEFLPRAATGRSNDARWQVAVPTLPRGLFALHSKYGSLPWQVVVIPAEELARFGAVVSRSFAHHLRFSSSTLVNDSNAIEQFSTPTRRMLQEGDLLINVELASTLANIRSRRPGDFYSGDLSKVMDEEARIAGLSLTSSDLRAFTPTWGPFVEKSDNETRMVWAGYALGDASFDSLLASDSQYVDRTGNERNGATTAFIVADVSGNVVGCTLTMGTPFGTGVQIKGAGFLAAPSPNLPTLEQPPMISVLAIDLPSSLLRIGAVAGGDGATEKTAMIIARSIRGETTPQQLYPEQSTVSDTRYAPLVNLIVCDLSMLANVSECRPFADPSGSGYALIASGVPN